MSIETARLTRCLACMTVPPDGCSQVTKVRPMLGTNGYWQEVEYYGPGVETLMLVYGFTSIKDYFESFGYEGVQTLDG